MRAVVFAVAIIFISACATKVTSLKRDMDILAEPNKGYLLLGIETNRDLKSIYISGEKQIMLTSTDIKQGTNYLLVDLKAGDYVIEKVLLDNSWQLSFEKKSKHWSFKVKPNQINYVGHFEIAQKGYSFRRTYTELVNRTSEAIEFMEEKYPNLLSNRQMAYGGPGEDDFIQHIYSEKK